MSPNKKSDSKSKSTQTKKLAAQVVSTQPGFPIEITGDKQAEEAFQISESYLLAVLQSTADGILAVGSETQSFGHFFPDEHPGLAQAFVATLQPIGATYSADGTPLERSALAWMQAAFIIGYTPR